MLYLDVEKRRKGGLICARLVLIGIFLLGFLASAVVKADVREPQRRSSSLRTIVNEEEDGVTETFVDEDGRITYAADKHYASVRIIRKDKAVLSEFFDENGNPEKQVTGQYATLREWNDKGQKYRTSYLGLDGQPIMISSGYSIITRTFDSFNRVETEMYGDTSGEPVCTPSMGYGRRYEYNRNNRKTKIYYLGKDGNVEQTKSGYAIIKRTYYEEGRNRGEVENEFYFDEDGAPVALSLG